MFLADTGLHVHPHGLLTVLAVLFVLLGAAVATYARRRG